MSVKRLYKIVFVLLLGLFIPILSFPISNVIKPDQGRDTRRLGDIFFGVKVTGGITNMMNYLTYESEDTKITDKRMYFYNLAITTEFYLESYVALIIDYGLHSIRFDRRSIWSEGPEGHKISERFFEQWFNRLTVSSRFLFWDIFYLQTGPSILINYNSPALIDFMGLPPDVNDNAGVSFSWQVGMGMSAVMGYKDNGDPLMTIDLGFYTYIPIVGNLIDSRTSINAGGTPIRIRSNPYQFEFALAFTFLV